MAGITNKLNVFNRLRTILGISWRDHVTNEKLMKMAEILDLQDIVTERRRRFAGHVILRLPDERPARVAMTWAPKMGKRRKGRPKRPYDRRFEKISMRWAKRGTTQPKLPTAS